MMPVQSNRPRRLQPLKVACDRIGISPRTYYRKRNLLPIPIKLGNKLMFAEHEIDALIDSLLAARNERSVMRMPNYQLRVAFDADWHRHDSGPGTSRPCPYRAHVADSY